MKIMSSFRNAVHTVRSPRQLQAEAHGVRNDATERKHYAEPSG
jgi:hypothetical protein